MRCLERERKALIEFKKGLLDDDGVLSSWGSEDHKRDCCKWWGVRCSNKTGHVTAIDLRCPVDDDFSPLQTPLGGKVSPSLLELRHLSYLDLSYNDFQGQSIPAFIGSLNSLKVLNLAFANFAGNVPTHLGNLTSLHILNVSWNFHLSINSLEWLSQLSSLRYLDLSVVPFEQTLWPETIVNLPHSLEKLRLSSCGLFETIPFTINSSASLSVVDFSHNNLTLSSVSNWLHNFSTGLTSIGLSYNNLAGPIPETFGYMEFLQHLDLSGNFFSGSIPKSFRNLSHLISLSLSDNQLSEPLSELLEKLSEHAGQSLESLWLDGNKLNGSLPDISTRFSSLRELVVSNNQLDGSLPQSFGLPSSLESLGLRGNRIMGLFPDIKSFGLESHLKFLDLSDNQITGPLPDLTPYSSMIELYLQDNQLQGVITEAHFSNLSQIKVLDLSFNSLSLNISDDWNPPFQLEAIGLASCKMGTQFPKWLQTQGGFFSLDISSAGISDTVPDWFWDLSPRIEYLNLSYNKIDGKVPDLSTKFSGSQVIDFSNNGFWGLIPSIPPEVKSFHLSHNKFSGSISFLCTDATHFTASLDLSYNQLSGEIPNCFENYADLVVLNLANNYFSGKLPHSLGFLQRLVSLHLRNNNFTGKFPRSLQNCTSLRMIDFGGNQFTGRIPPWIWTSLSKLIIVSLRHNKFSGDLPPSLCHLNNIQVLDFSRNRMAGRIPSCFYNFTSLIQKNNSTGKTIVGVGEYFGAVYNNVDYIDNILIQWKNQDSEYRNLLRFLKSIDLSSNHLIGDIPEEFSVLRGLISLNLSRNHLTGKIIPGINQMEMLESLDLSRNQLSGEIPAGLAHLNFLSVLDLSNNNLSGKIPSGTQLQSINATSYAGNSGLCGDPLPKCHEDVPAIKEKGDDYEEEEDDDRLLTLEFYISMVLGFSVSFWGFVVTLFLKDSWRYAYYRFLSDSKDWVYVTMKVSFVRLQRKFWPH
ncbi:PREDICTED: receptor-like protein 12 [Ipomoea nil]|uniref:receptor-like protein 12 n=1 Tax=Ipomoea nil TaxID=35883 RepID=UPI0009013E74|nr:PREDICTED: receptor-like protein 12 [Ipomoea nil]